MQCSKECALRNVDQAQHLFTEGKMKIHNGEVIGTRTSDRSQASDLLLKLVRKNVPSASPHGHCPILLTVVLPNVPGQLRDAPVSCTDLCLPQGTEFIHLLFWLTFLAHFLSDL